jgi:signal peptidase II
MQENTHPGNLIPGNSKTVAAALIAGAAVFALDQWLKIALFANPSLMEGSWLMGLVRFSDHRNFGISFNLPVPFLLMLLIALAALVWSIYELIKLSPSDRYRALALGIFMGGVLGNLYDRVTLGFVRDWLLLWGRSAVNLADGAILVGLISYLLRRKA